MEASSILMPETDQAHPCVMVVEDDQRIGEALTHLLHAEGYRVDRCWDGKEAIAHLRAGTHPDVILLDLMMPHVNAWEFRVQQKHEPEWAEIPVIVMSADDSPQASAIDADAYLKKPFADTVLLDSLGRLLHGRNQARRDARAAELDRMNALGVLAAGLTHEINNPLALISGNLQLSQRKCRQVEKQLPADAKSLVDDLTHMLAQAQAGVDRIADVVRGVSAFAHPDTDHVVPMHIQEVLESSLQLVANEVRHHAQIVREYAPVPAVLGNPAKLQQVFTNLLINALHAMDGERATANVLRVATRVGTDNQVVVSISDSGNGIGPEVLAHIFDPFFSTKEVGTGMGLGLAICQRLISNMGGTISVSTAQGRGSTFSVTFPKRERAQAATPPPATMASTSKRASVLVVDDENMMCDLLQNMLQEQYDVTTISNPREALPRLLQGEPFDLVLCDLMMPELTGMDLHTELSKTRPEQAARFVFMTGGTFTERARDFLDQIEGAPLNKPFRAEELYAMVSQRLQRFSERESQQPHAYN